MKTYIRPANGKYYDHMGSFNERGFIDWRQDNKYEYHVGDVVYIYNNKSSNPPMRLRYKTVITKINMSLKEIVDDKEFWSNLSEYEKGIKAKKFYRLRLVKVLDEEGLDYDSLRANGLTTNLPGTYKVNDTLLTYIDSVLEKDDAQLSTIENEIIDADKEAPVFPETDMPYEAFEGAKKQVLVNKYERSAEARKKCIEYHGCRCTVCCMDFGETYGEVGQGFIHVHHIVPLNEINQEYKVNYKTDLIPVCPNCHAMLHRAINGKAPTLEELQWKLNHK